MWVIKKPYFPLPNLNRKQIPPDKYLITLLMNDIWHLSLKTMNHKPLVTDYCLLYTSLAILCELLRELCG